MATKRGTTVFSRTPALMHGVMSYSLDHGQSVLDDPRCLLSVDGFLWHLLYQLEDLPIQGTESLGEGRGETLY